MERLVNYRVNQKKKRTTLIDDQKYEYNFEKIKNGTEFSCSGANSTENARKQKQRDKRTRIKNMTEMYNNIPVPDYMKQLATILAWTKIMYICKIKINPNK